MKKVMLGVVFGMLVGCASRYEMPPAPTLAMSEASGIPVATLQRGRAVYVSDCTRCHEAMMPKDISQDDWHVVLPGMAWNSGISPADEKAVEAYILAVKAQKAES